MSSPLSQAFAQNFLGHSPRWYKLTVLAFLLLNPLLLWLAGPVTSAWVLVGEFIFTLAMALKCYPLQPGGLLVLEALLLGLATPEALYAELQHNFPVLLLLMFMVAGIYFMKDLLLLLFSRLLLGVRSKTLLSLLFCLLAALLSAFLDALTVTAVVISVAVAFFAVYHRVASGQRASEDYDPATDRQVPELHRAHLEEFRAFLRSLLMHAAVGTALGGVCTLVGEPQNLLIGHEAGWHFVEFFRQVAPVSMPVLAAGLLTCVLLVMVLGFWLGDALEERLGLVLPSYVGAMFIAIVLRNLDDRLGWLRIPDHAVGTLGDVCLGIFLTMAMMSLKFWELENLGLPLLGVLFIQVAVLLLLTIFVLFRLLGRNYDAAVLCAGFLGHGLGATPNAVANMGAVCEHYRVFSHKAFIIVPLCGAVLIDLVAIPAITWFINAFS
ncbi:hypothetical protein HKW73_04300 [Pseudomonas aeruginosa]|nr:hypothetical protein [Pseudomonas aeruginosa]MBF3251264.1 hypothetical protein [Pseudomonas aeruginosa]MBF3270606.1 hypothetical protein [Pseudomonas aeruginosa]MBF3285391.1 hypothetical protein [Pseudomonas aeruginosa]MBF3300508.1 hypothetical protein [Pseudomonas aeruginosa]